MFFLLSFLLSLSAHAATQRSESVEGENKVVKVSFRIHKVKLQPRKEKGTQYQKVIADQLPLTSDVGQPALPFQAVTLNAAAGEIRVRAELGKPITLNAGKIYPAQEEPCRCPELSPRRPEFTDKLVDYQASESGFRVESLGDFRGQAVSRVLLLPHKYDPRTGSLLVYPSARFEITYPAAAAPKVASVYEYLVLTPRNLMGGLADWVAWKKSSQNLRFNVVAIEDLALPDANALKTWIHAEYGRAGFKYALLVGGRSQIPQLSVPTSTTPQTPSDLPYFTMGDANDVIPEVLAGRVVASSADQLHRVLKKWIVYERDESAAPGWGRGIGIASNEGANPSDAEYVTAVQDKFKAAFGTEKIYLFENNADSTPAYFNNQLAGGAMWVTYLGHGSGTSWPSFGQTYSVSDIANLRNANAVKPVWIDVACLNGALEADKAGAHLTGDADPSGEPIGVTAYYGGTVLISWHPPAIFARGVAFQLADMARPVLGEALQAGQRYLTENTSNLNDIASNQRWYHLQGDPSLRLRLK